MVRSISSSATDAHGTAYQVERPRVSDAVGLALRNVYGDAHGLPQDMIEILHRLNGYAQCKMH